MKREKTRRLITVAILSILATSTAETQTGGSFNLSHNVIASGGGSNSVGGAYRVDGTTGQASAGTVSIGIAPGGTSFVLRGGFWAFEQLAPTAAMVGVAGRVATADGRGIRNATVLLTDSAGTTRQAATGSLGYYRFENVAAGQTYIISVSSRRFTFSKSTLVIDVSDELANVDFTADPL